MKGTEKQVAWAEKIRASLKKLFVGLEEKYGPAPEPVRIYMEKIFSHDDARYWIDYWRDATHPKADLAKALCECNDEVVSEAAFEWIYLK